MRLCIVYLGHSLPDYVKYNLLQIRQNFGGNELYFISDSEDSCKLVSKLGILTFLVEDVLQTAKHLTEIQSIDREFRQGFWMYTSGRFKAISEFMQFINDSESILQIEADVWLAPNFPMEAISLIPNDFAFPMTQKSTGLASTLFIRNQQSAKFLSEYFNSLLIAGKYVIDYEILGQLQMDHPSKVYVLPSAFNCSSGFNPSADLAVQEIMTFNSNFFEGIFDGATWGQYLTGEDPRNLFGIRRVFHFQSHHAANPTQVKFTVMPFKGVYCEFENEKKFMFSLHIHSKDIRIFKDDGLEFVAKRINQIGKGTRNEFQFKVLKSLMQSDGIRNLTRKLFGMFKGKFQSLLKLHKFIR